MMPEITVCVTAGTVARRDSGPSCTLEVSRKQEIGARREGLVQVPSLVVKRRRSKLKNRSGQNA
jgi:hypothetical protein